MSQTGDVLIKLSNDEAIVPFELLSQFGETGSLQIQSRAETIALLNVCALLEKQLVEPFLPNYEELLLAAHVRITNTHPELPD